MSEFVKHLERQLDCLRQQGLYRELRRIDSAQGPRIEFNGRTFINFSSNDYLGLANHPVLINAAIRAVEKFGAGSGASRLICGSLAPHHELEETLASFKGTEKALSFSSGYAAAIGTITPLLGKDDIIIIDKLVHACIVDAAKLSGAKLRVFAHNDLNDLEDILKWAAQTAQSETRILIVTESVFSMDGDLAPLNEIVALKEKFGAWLMVDEAHATGLYGNNRRGLVEELGLSNRIEVQIGTLGKAVGASGGFICGSRALIDFLINRARSFIFSTAPAPATAASATAGIHFIQSTEGEQRSEKTWALAKRLKRSTTGELLNSATSDSLIIPVIIGDESAAVAASKVLLEEGILIPAIRYPTVARGTARLRATITAAHTEDDIDRLTSALSKLAELKV